MKRIWLCVTSVTLLIARVDLAGYAGVPSLAPCPMCVPPEVAMLSGKGQPSLNRERQEDGSLVKGSYDALLEHPNKLLRSLDKDIQLVIPDGHSEGGKSLGIDFLSMDVKSRLETQLESPSHQVAPE